MKRVNSYGTGNHYVNLKIVVPKKLTEKQKALIYVINFNLISLFEKNITTINFCLQLYAELEENTPGQILGVTYKKDGKSNDSSSTSSFSSSSTKSKPKADEEVSSKYTQGAKHDDFNNYSATDTSETHETKKDQLGRQFYFAMGFFLIFCLAFWYNDSRSQDTLNRERDASIERQRIRSQELERQRIEQEEYLQQKSMKDIKSPFSSA